MYPIVCYTITSKGEKHEISFNWFGKYTPLETSKCLIFPKGRTTWEGFVPPCKFKEGDVVTNIDGAVAIYREITTYGYCGSFVSLDRYNQLIPHYDSYLKDCIRLATEEEKARLFQAIKDNDYHWNAETKTLEKLVEPRFKVGDRVKARYNGYQYDIKELTDTHYTLVEVEHKFQYTEPIIEDKHWELVPNKFDTNTLKPLQPVLVRNTNGQVWAMNLFSHKIDTNKGLQTSFVCVGYCPNQCIPYEGNEHLLGKVDACIDFYKTWE